MRKMNILNEDYIYLQQLLAETSDRIDKRLSDIKDTLTEYLTFDVKGGVSFRETAQFINKKNMLTSTRQEFDTLYKAITESGKLILKRRSFTIKESAMLTKLYNLILEENIVYENDFQDVVSIFGEQHSDIPEAEEGNYEVQITNEGVFGVITKIGHIANEMLVEKENVLSKAQTLDEFKDSTIKLTYMQEFCNVLRQK